MTEETPRRRLWVKVDAALRGHGERLAKGEAQFLKEVRLAVDEYTADLEGVEPSEVSTSTPSMEISSIPTSETELVEWLLERASKVGGEIRFRFILEALESVTDAVSRDAAAKRVAQGLRDAGVAIVY